MRREIVFKGYEKLFYMLAHDKAMTYWYNVVIPL